MHFQRLRRKLTQLQRNNRQHEAMLLRRLIRKKEKEMKEAHTDYTEDRVRRELDRKMRERMLFFVVLFFIFLLIVVFVRF